MQPGLSLMSALAGLIIFGLLSCHVIRGDEPQVNCSVVIEEGDAYLTCEIPSSMDIAQVTWQKRRGNSYETLVTQSKSFGIQISEQYESRLSVLETKDPGTSAIVLLKLAEEDGACFMAIFNVDPYGDLIGEVCLPKRGVSEVICKGPADFSVTLDPPEIKTQHPEPDGAVMQIGRWSNDDISPVCNFQLRRTARTKRSVSDEPQVNCTVVREEGITNLTCKIPSSMDIVQVTWQKGRGNSYETMVTNSKRFGIKISKPYEGRLSVLPTKDPGTSSIALSQLENDTCFMAIFNIYPDGALKGEGCLSKFYRNEILTIECSASGAQKPTITWRNEGRPISREEKENRTGDVIMVTSTLHHSLSTLPEDIRIGCNVVYNKDDGTSCAQDHDNQYQKTSCIIIAVSSVIATALVLCLMFFVVRYFIKRRKQPKSPQKDEIRIETPTSERKHLTSDNPGTPGTETKKRKILSVENNKEITPINKDDSGYCPYSDEDNTPHRSNVTDGSPGSEIKQRISPTQKMTWKNGKRLQF